MPLNNRAIGVINDVEVWIKPWVPANYIITFIRGTRPVVRIRQRGGLEMVADNEQYPLRCQTLEHLYGVGVLERTAMAVLYINGGSYVAPTIS